MTALLSVEPPELGEPARASTNTPPKSMPTDRLWEAPLGATAFALVALVVLRPRFEANDDVAMMWIADGTAFGSPLPHLVFTNQIIGEALAELYTRWPGLSWYPTYLVGALWLSAVAQIRLVRQARLRGQQALLAAASLTAVNLMAWLNLQFTSAAGVVGVTGVALYALGGADRHEPPVGGRLRGTLSAGAAGALIGLSSWMRIESAQLALVVGLPLILWGVRRRQAAATVAFAVMAAVLVVGGAAYDRQATSGEEWDSYRSWTEVRGMLHDTPRLIDPAEAADDLAAVSWSVNDGIMFREWFFFDEEIFSTARVEALAERRDPDRSPERMARELARRGLRIFPVLVITLAASALAVRSSREHQRLAAATAIVASSVAGWLLLTAKLPMRVTLPIFLGFLLTTVLPARRSTRPSEYRTPAVVAVCSLLLMIGASVTTWQTRAEAEAADAGAILDGLHALDPEGTFVLWGGPVPAEFAHPFDRGGDPRVQLVLGGWPDRSPMQNELLAELGITNVAAAIVNDPHVHLVVTRELADPASVFERYLREHDIDGTLVVESTLRGIDVLGCGSTCTG